VSGAKTAKNVIIAEFRVSGELHIAGIVVHANPLRLESVRDAIAALPSLEIHGANAQGKIVLTVEAPSAADVLHLLDAIHCIEGVVAAFIVYQHSEDSDSMNEEISHDNHAPGIY